MRRIATIAAASVLAVGLASCSAPQARYVAEGGDHDAASVESLLADTDFSDVEDVATSDAAGLREDVLVALRTEGDGASEAADMLTSGFPQPTEAVPVLVEAGTFEGMDAWIVLEAWGEEDGTLTHRRAWVFDRGTGDLLWTGSLR